MYEFSDKCKTCMCSFVETSLRLLPLGVIVVELKDKNIQFINPKAENLLSDLNVEVKGRSVIEKFGQGESRLVIKERSKEGVVVAVLSYIDENNNNIWYFMHEISEDIIDSKYECELSCMLKMDFLLSIMRHELGNPLNAIKITLEVLYASFGNFSNEKKMEYIKRSLEEIKHMELLLKWLRDYKLKGNLKDVMPVRLKGIVSQIHTIVEAELKRKNIRLFLFCDPREDIMVYGEPSAIKMVLLNVIRNAIEALENRQDATLSISGEAGDKYLYLMIRDNGPGIAEENLSKVFTPLFTTKKYGSGLGLAISKNLMLKMGGNISVKSKEGEGTEVTLIFKRVKNA